MWRGLAAFQDTSMYEYGPTGLERLDRNSGFGRMDHKVQNGKRPRPDLAVELGRADVRLEDHAALHTRAIDKP